MQIGPGCYTVAPTRTIQVSGPFFPWQNDYEVVKQEEENSPGISQLVRTSARVGERLFTMEPLTGLTWVELDIRPVGTALRRTGEEPPTVDDVDSASALLKLWTPIKVRVYYQNTAGNINTFDCDVGTGVIITVPPTNKVEVDILVPRRQGIEEKIANGSAPPIQGAALATLDFSTSVSCKATCVSSPGPSRAHYTQLIYLDSSTEAGTNGAQLKLQPYASSVQLLLAPFAGSVAPAPGQFQARLRREVIPQGQGAVPDVLNSLFPFFDIPFTNPSQSEKVDIPRPHANVVRVRTAAVPAGRRMNVLIDQELFFS